MKQLLMAGGLLALLVGAGQAVAQNCGGTGQSMTPLNIKNKVIGKYTCVGSFPHAQWNELLSGSANSGNVIDYKLGPTDPIDPTKQVGTYTVTVTGNNVGILTYTYGSTSYAYQIQKPSTLGTSFTALFCPQGSGYSGPVNVQPSHC